MGSCFVKEEIIERAGDFELVLVPKRKDFAEMFCCEPKSPVVDHFIVRNVKTQDMRIHAFLYNARKHFEMCVNSGKHTVVTDF